VNARELDNQLEQLRGAATTLRARKRSTVIDALAAVFDAWAEPGSTWQQRLVRELPGVAGFGPEMVRAAAAAGFARYSAAALRGLLRVELESFEASGRSRGSGPDVTALFLAGAVPMPALISMAAPLLVQSCPWIRPSARDPVTPQLVVASIAAVDPELATCMEFASFRPEDSESVAAFLRADAVVVTGSNATVTAIARRCPPGVVPIAYGHRISIAIVGRDATAGDALHRAAAGLAQDVAFWDQLGCLSPVAVWVIDSDPRANARVAEAIARGLAVAEEHWPRGAVDTASAAQLRVERDAARMRQNVGVRTDAASAWTVVCENDAKLRPAPLHRFVRVHPCASVGALAEALEPLRGQLTGVAAAGWGREHTDLLDLCARLGASRICSPGALQTPPLAWHHDNHGVLTPLIRWCDMELP